ncbi:monocyte differentiation antigen cd14 isoform x1 [Gigaspora margarita]|uniref:Monocyte differentiation antigen cd14 isoform x1 n=1 Tax=Gigaspora margarita TaxID=4874 RepID=A0A8H4B2X8_GIGMA|nr:monocyte differentiation antigen cd14 isoform x1 [Gigaspora margarita]
MVNAQTWLDQNYPANSTCIRVEDKENYGKTINQIVNLDISNQNLEGPLQLSNSLSSLKKLNCSFNNITKIFWDSLPNLEDLDKSHNQLAGSNFALPNSPSIKTLNFSYNSISAYYFETPNLAYLDVTSNLLTILDLHSTANLVELKCSNNQISNLTLTQSPKLVLFDCLGVRFVSTSNITPTSTSSSSFSTSFPILPTTTIYTNNPTLLGSTIGLGIYSGISTLCWLILSFTFIYKHLSLKSVIPTPGDSSTSKI